MNGLEINVWLGYIFIVVLFNLFVFYCIFWYVSRVSYYGINCFYFFNKIFYIELFIDVVMNYEKSFFGI